MQRSETATVLELMTCGSCSNPAFFLQHATDKVVSGHLYSSVSIPALLAHIIYIYALIWDQYKCVCFHLPGLMI